MSSLKQVNLWECKTAEEQEGWIKLALQRGQTLSDSRLWLGGVDRPAAIIAKLPAQVLPVGVFVNAGQTELQQAVRESGIRAVQLHGGLGVTRGVKVEELYREIRALRIYEGATDVQKIVIAREALKSHGSGRV